MAKMAKITPTPGPLTVAQRTALCVDILGPDSLRDPLAEDRLFDDTPIFRVFTPRDVHGGKARREANVERLLTLWRTFEAYPTEAIPGILEALRRYDQDRANWARQMEEYQTRQDERFEKVHGEAGALSATLRDIADTVESHLLPSLGDYFLLGKKARAGLRAAEEIRKNGLFPSEPEPEPSPKPESEAAHV